LSTHIANMAAYKLCTVLNRKDYKALGFYYWLNSISLLSKSSPVIQVKFFQSRGKPARCGLSADDVSYEQLLAGIEIPRSTGGGKEWDLFVSYSQKDKAAVQEIIIDLKAAGVRYWWDEERIGADHTR
jgi:hypothetical protein